VWLQFGAAFLVHRKPALYLHLVRFLLIHWVRAVREGQISMHYGSIKLTLQLGAKRCRDAAKPFLSPA
jgi:hypothetical protein